MIVNCYETKKKICNKNICWCICSYICIYAYISVFKDTGMQSFRDHLQLMPRYAYKDNDSDIGLNDNDNDDVIMIFLLLLKSFTCLS